jgi:hypothetical protein
MACARAECSAADVLIGIGLLNIKNTTALNIRYGAELKVAALTLTINIIKTMVDAA